MWSKTGKENDFVLISLVAVLILANLNGASGIGFSRLRLSNNQDDIKFYLYFDKNNTDNCEEIVHKSTESLAKSHYNPALPVTLLFHGALSDFKATFDVQLLKDAYLETKIPRNFIMVDYGKLVNPRLPLLLSPLSLVHFVTGHLRTDRIARRVANFILFLIEAKSLSGPEDVRLIGLSLGAHVAGAVGSHVRSVTSKKIARITGLDPSPQLPVLSFLLDPTDAEFVDVTFTSFGAVHKKRRRGHVQFFINGGGGIQPTCPNWFPFIQPYCGHALAPAVYAKSIKNLQNPTRGCSCSRLFCGSRFASSTSASGCIEPTVFGEYVPTNTRGNFYVNLR